MIRLSKLTDYGFVLLTRLARAESDEVLNAHEMSEEVNVPQPTVSKLLKALTRGGLLKAQRGAKGGYALARPPQQITVADVISALEGPIAMTDCSAEEGCSHESDCPNKSNWQRISNAMFRALSDITLHDMADGNGSLNVRVSGARQKSCNCGPHCRTFDEVDNPADACTCECHVNITQLLARMRNTDDHAQVMDAPGVAHGHSEPEARAANRHRGSVSEETRL